MFVRRDRKGVNRFTPWRAALLFLAAGVWLGGVLTENSVATAVAIGILLVALLLGPLGRARGD